MTGTAESDPGCDGSESELRGTGFSSPRRTNNPRSAEQSGKSSSKALNPNNKVVHNMKSKPYVKGSTEQSLGSINAG